MKPSSSDWVKDVSEATFEADVLQVSDETPVIVDFWSPTCGPCRTLGPMLEKLTLEREGRVRLAKVNTDDNPRLASYFGISAIPAIRVIYGRKLVHEFDGLMPEAALREFFDQISPPGTDPELLKAQEEEAASPQRAETLYREMLAEDTNRHEARVGLARALLHQGKYDEIAELLEPVGSSGDLGAESDALLARVFLLQQIKDLPDIKTLREKAAAEPNSAQAHLDLGTALAAHENVEEALPELLRAAELDFKLAFGPVREVMVKAFYILGTNHPLANDYRSRLSRLLY